MRGGRAAAVIYTLIESCKQVDVDPVEYFADVLPKVRGRPVESSIRELAPAEWGRRVADTAAVDPAATAIA